MLPYAYVISTLLIIVSQISFHAKKNTKLPGLTLKSLYENFFRCIARDHRFEINGKNDNKQMPKHQRLS